MVYNVLVLKRFKIKNFYNGNGNEEYIFFLFRIRKNRHLDEIYGSYLYKLKSNNHK